MSPSEWAVLAGAGASIALVNWYFFVAGRRVGSAVGAPATAGEDAIAAAGTVSPSAVVEVVIVVDGGYSPNTVRARKGERIRLVFDRKDDSSCSEEVVIPAFGVKKFLPSGERTTIDITPTESGRIPFSCGMGMLRGTIVVEE